MANVNQQILVALERLIVSTEAELVEIEKINVTARRIAVEQEATNARLDKIISLLTPPLVAAVRGVYGAPQPNKRI